MPALMWIAMPASRAWFMPTFSCWFTADRQRLVLSTFSLRFSLTWRWLSLSISSFLSFLMTMSRLPPSSPPADQQLHVAFDVLDLVALDVQVLVLVDQLALVAALLAVLLPADDQVAVVEHPLHAVVLDAHVHVALGVDEDLLLALGVVEAHLVEALAARRACCVLMPLTLLSCGCLASGPLPR